jgi:hypothetical protein
MFNGSLATFYNFSLYFESHEVTTGQRAIVDIGTRRLLIGSVSWYTSTLRAKFERKENKTGRQTEIFNRV